MASNEPSIELRGDAPDVFDQFRSERRLSLVGAEDDMWAAFADLAAPHALVVDHEIVGCCSIDDEHRLHAFYVGDAAKERAAEVLARVVDDLEVTALMTSTVDPGFLSLGLSLGGRAEAVGLLYEHTAQPTTTDTVDLQQAGVADHTAAVAFCVASTGAPKEFQASYLAERIGRHELHLVVDADGQILATGECRLDTRTNTHAHLGLIVGSDRRGHGLGSKLIHSLTQLAVGKGLDPLCSTEPTNVAAQRAIHRAGFRSRHRVFQIATAGRQGSIASG